MTASNGNIEIWSDREDEPVAVCTQNQNQGRPVAEKSTVRWESADAIAEICTPGATELPPRNKPGLFLRHRHRQPELMDDPALPREAHFQALCALRRVNWWTGIAGVFEQAILRHSGLMSERIAGGRPMRILDIASGGGDLTLNLAARLQKRGVKVQIDGCDISHTAVQFASLQADKIECRNVRFFQHDVLQEELQPESYDVVMSSLFMHHLNEQEAVRLLQIMRQTSRSLVLLDDLRRSSLGYWLAWAGCRLLTRSSIVHFDGPVSVQGALSVAECKRLAVAADWNNTRVCTHWPQRFLMEDWRSA